MGWSLILSASLFVSQCCYLARIPLPSLVVCEEGDKNMTHKSSQRRGTQILPINQCGGATYNQANGSRRHAVIHAMMSLAHRALRVCVVVCVCGVSVVCNCVCVCLCVCGEGRGRRLACGCVCIRVVFLCVCVCVSCGLYWLTSGVGFHRENLNKSSG